MRFIQGGTLLLTAGEDGVALRYAESGNELKKLTTSDLHVRAAGFGLGGEVVWVAGADGVFLWSAETGVPLPELPGLHGELTSAAVSADGKALWLADSAGRVFVAPFGP